MDVLSDLKNASLEVWTQAEEDIIATTCRSARIGFNATTGRIRIWDGSEFKTLPMSSDGDFQVGDIKATTRTQAEMGSSWLSLDGYGLYDGDGEPYLASQFPELAATVTGSSWILNADLGYGGAKDYMFVPDMRDATLMGVSGPDLRLPIDLGGGFPPTQLPDNIARLVSSNQIVDGDPATKFGLGQIQVPSAPQSISTAIDSLGNPALTTIEFQQTGSDVRRVDNVAFRHPSNPEFMPIENVVKSATYNNLAGTGESKGLVTQALRTNFYIKARSSV